MLLKRNFIITAFSAAAGIALAGATAADDYDHHEDYDRHGDGVRHTIEIERRTDWTEASGYVEEISENPPIIVLKAYNDTDRSIYTDQTIYVAQEAVIIKDGEAIPLKSIHPNDYITVKYLISNDFQREAYKIWVK